MAKLPVASIVGGETLIGRELNDLSLGYGADSDVRLVSSHTGFGRDGYWRGGG